MSTTIIGKGGAGKAKVYVVAFGKHPAWDDHIDEIGLENDLLVRLKRVLYTEGLAGNIDSGAWDKLEESKRLPGYDHAFYWRTAEGWLIGRMWSSVDGKGRTKYPMIVGAILAKASLREAIDQVLPRLEAFKSGCIAARDKGSVRAAADSCRAALEDAAALLAGTPSTVGVTDGDTSLIRRLVTHPDLDMDGTSRLGLKRVMYEMHRELGAYRSGSKNTSAGTVVSAQHLRVPRCLTGQGESAKAWLALLRSQIVPTAPLLVFEALDQPFIDIIVGEPTSSSLFCVRASAAGLPPTHLVPYTIEHEFMAKADATIAAWIEGRDSSPAQASTKARSPAAAADAGHARPKLPLSLIVGGVLVLIGIVVGILIIIAPSQVAKAKADGTLPADATPQSPTPSPGATAPTAPAAAEERAFKPGDPRSTWSFESTKAAIVARLDRFDQSVADRSATTGSAVPAASPAAPLRQKLERATRNARDAYTTPYSPANSDTITSSIALVDKELAEVAGGVKTLEDESREALSAFLRSAAAKAPVAGPASEKAWASRIGQMDPAAGWKAVGEQMRQLAAVLGDAQKQAGDLSPLETFPPVAGVDIQAISQAAAAARQAAADRIAESTTSGDAQAAQMQRQEWALWQSDMRSACATADRLAKALAAGDVERAMAAGKELAASGGYGVAPKAFARLHTAASALAAASSPDRASVLIEIVRAWDGDALGVAGVMAAAGSFGAMPRTAAELGEFSQVSSKAIAAGDPVAAAVRGSLGKATEATLKASLADPAAAEAILKAVPDHAGPAVIAARYNIRLGELKRNAASLDSVQLGDAVTAFASAPDCSAAAAFPDAVQTLEALRAAAEQAKSAAGAKTGSSGPGGKGWTSRVTESGAVIFTFTHNETALALAFRRVEAGGTTASWVSTTEVPVGVFLEIAAASSKVDDLFGLMAKTVVGGKDMRVGPRTWVWGKAPVGNARAILLAKPSSKDLSSGWLAGVTDLGGKAYYAPDVSSAPPAPESPAQYLSPQAAAYWATLVGCRLPTVAEWKAAAADSHASSRPSNRRDPAWLAQFKQVQSLNSGGAQIQWPNAGIFYPPNTTRPGASQDSSVVSEKSDGHVWFMPVESASEQFDQVIGNVAEYVTETVLAENAADAAAVETQLGSGAAVRVIGASALSPSAVDPSVALPMVWTAAREGYSDVGFRLAFSAAPVKPADAAPGVSELARLVQEARFVRIP